LPIRGATEPICYEMATLAEASPGDSQCIGEAMAVSSVAHGRHWACRRKKRRRS